MTQEMKTPGEWAETAFRELTGHPPLLQHHVIQCVKIEAAIIGYARELLADDEATIEAMLDAFKPSIHTLTDRERMRAALSALRRKAEGR